MKSFPVCKFTCASCNSSYIGETSHHFKTNIEEHIKKDNESHIFMHLHSTPTCFNLYNSLCFKIIDKANSKFHLKIKEVLHINWRKANLNAEQNHLVLTLWHLFVFLLLIFAIFFHLSIFLFSLSLLLLSAPLTVLKTLCYYFISLWHTL